MRLNVLLSIDSVFIATIPGLQRSWTESQAAEKQLLRINAFKCDLKAELLSFSGEQSPVRTQWRIHKFWKWGGGRKTIYQLRPHLSQMRTTKYMPFTRKKRLFLTKMWANISFLNPPLGPSRCSSHSKRRQSAAWEFTHCLPWRSRQWPSTVWWDVFPPVPGQVLGAVARAQTTDSGRIFADAARTDFLPKQICFTKLTNNVEKKSIVRIKSIDIS